MQTIYILECQYGKYYVGKTSRNVYSRINEHFSNYGSLWTKKYKPLKVVEIIENADLFDEDKYTKKYMLKYGINNVRGGIYSTFILPDYKLKTLREELCCAENRCYICMKKGHFASQCTEKEIWYDCRDDFLY